MRFTVQIISSHAVFANSILETLSHDSFLRRSVFINEFPWPKRHESPKIPMYLLDMCGPGLEPGALCKSLRRRHPLCKLVCLLSPSQAREDYMLNLFCVGVEGIVCLKRRWGAELRRVVRNVLRGKLCIPPLVLQKYARETSSLLESDSELNRILTAREVQVAHLAIRQFSTRAIAGELSISERTVKFHVANIFIKTGVRSRHQLLASLSFHKSNESTNLREHLVIRGESGLKSPERKALAASASD